MQVERVVFAWEIQNIIETAIIIRKEEIWPVEGIRSLRAAAGLVAVCRDFSVRRRILFAIHVCP